jgi:hypothetical protein
VLNYWKAIRTFVSEWSGHSRTLTQTDVDYEIIRSIRLAWNWSIERLILLEFSFWSANNHIVFWNIARSQESHPSLVFSLELDCFGIVLCCGVAYSILSYHVMSWWWFLVSNQSFTSAVTTLSSQFRTFDILSVFRNDSDNNVSRVTTRFENVDDFAQERYFLSRTHSDHIPTCTDCETRNANQQSKFYLQLSWIDIDCETFCWNSMWSRLSRLGRFRLPSWQFFLSFQIFSHMTNRTNVWQSTIFELLFFHISQTEQMFESDIAFWDSVNGNIKGWGKFEIQAVTATETETLILILTATATRNQTETPTRTQTNKLFNIEWHWLKPCLHFWHGWILTTISIHDEKQNVRKFQHWTFMIIMIRHRLISSSQYHRKTRFLTIPTLLINHIS